MAWLSQIVGVPLFTLFLVIALGVGLGAVRVGGFRLGVPAVFFVALGAGHLGWSLPRELTELGLVLFVYAVGLQVGSRFLALFQARAMTYLGVGLAATGAGALATVALAWATRLPAHLAAGLYCGATTCTPALAAALDVIGRSLPEGAGEAAVVAYGVAYPFSLACVVLTVQSLPRLLRRNPADVAAEYNARAAERAAVVESCAFRITNANCAGMRASEFAELNLAAAVLSRIKHEGRLAPVRPDTTLHLHDVVLAVGPPVELAKLETLLGDVVVEPMSAPADEVASEPVQVSRSDAVGKSLSSLGAWQRYGVTVTRVRREGIEFTPRGDFVLEQGDVLRVVGAPAEVRAFAQRVGHEERRLTETSLAPFALGIVLGIVIGAIPLPLPGSVDARLGPGGGAFLAAVLLTRLGRVGPVRLYVPSAAKVFARDLGLVIFLAGAGLGAGRDLVHVVARAGPALALGGAVVTLVTVAVYLLLVIAVARWDLLTGAGGLSACMTNPGALASTEQLADSEAAPLAFASLYPVALIAKIVLAQAVFVVVGGLGG